MADNKKIKGRVDASRVSLSEDYEVEYWTDRFRVSRAALEEAVKKVGPMANDVERELALARQNKGA